MQRNKKKQCKSIARVDICNYLGYICVPIKNTKSLFHRQ